MDITGTEPRTKVRQAESVSCPDLREDFIRGSDNRAELPWSLQEGFPVLGRLHDALPLDAARRLAEAQQEAVTRLQALIETDFRSREVRAAMGWAGFEEVKAIDDFIRRNIESGKFIPVNQTPWLKSHSGMQEPTEELREKVYRDVIVRRMLEDGSFGRYPPLPPQR